MHTIYLVEMRVYGRTAGIISAGWTEQDAAETSRRMNTEGLPKGVSLAVVPISLYGAPEEEGWATDESRNGAIE